MASEGELLELVERAGKGDGEAWKAIVERLHARLRRMVALRLDARLHGRIDPSDVLQDAYIDAFHQLPAYASDPKIPFFLWMRLLTGHRLAKIHRYHLGAQGRDVAREISLFRGGVPEASSAVLVGQLLGRDLSPDELAAKAELRFKLQEALNAMEPLDREALALRHFEQLTTTEAAEVLGVSQAAAGKRYIRALAKIKGILGPRTPSGAVE